MIMSNSTSPRWRKSSYSGQSIETDCVELADLSHTIGIRDSKNPAGDHLTISRSTLSALIIGIKA